MRLKGTMVMELMDAQTGEVEAVTEENMITNAVNNILGSNPMGVFYSEEELADVLAWNGTMLQSTYSNMVGGILLFSKALEENADTMYVGSDNLPVAYASNNVNSSANTARGSMNLTESKALENGYRFVWEFTPSQGNGTIAAVALTSAQGGLNGFGSLVGDASTFLRRVRTPVTCPRRSRRYCSRRWRWILRGTFCIPLLLRIPACGYGRCGYRYFLSG